MEVEKVKRILYGAMALLLAMVILPLYALADDNVLSTRAQLVAYLTKAAVTQPAEIPFQYASNLNSGISDSNWMSDVLNEAGIFGASWSYGGGECTLKSITYMPAHVVCTTEAETLAALRSAASGNVNIRFPKSFFTSLRANNFEWLHQLEGAAGIDSRKMTYYEASGLVLYSEIVYAENFSSVSTVDELRQLMKSYRSKGQTGYAFHCTEDLYRQLAAKEFDKLHQLEGEAGFETRTMTYHETKYQITYADIVYARYLASVSTMAELRQAMQHYQQAAQKEYTIHCEDSLYQQLLQNDFARLRQVEGEVGFKKRSMSYNEGKRTIIYSEIEYAANLTTVRTLGDFKQQMLQLCLALKDEFAFHCSEELYSILSRNDFAYLHAVESNCGIYLRDMNYSDEKRMLTYTNIEYYPGYYIAQSLKLGETWRISGRLLTLYKEARQILQDVKARCGSDRLALQSGLQEAIMSRVEYLKGFSDGDQDTAYGALLNGRCECDGYADAFYLLADIAGFNVRFQQGKDITDGESHLWNVIEHDGMWFFTDLTWCDSTNDFHHLYSNIGKDVAAQGYVWVEECSLVPLQAYTSRNYYFYLRENVYFQDHQEAASYVNRQLRAGSSRVEILVNRTANQDIETFADGFCDRINVSYRANYKYTDQLVSFIFYPGR